MRTRVLPGWAGVVLIVAVATSGGWAAELAKEERASSRAAITKGLEFVTKQGDVWIEDKNCNSCHHLPEMLWSHREAKRRGFAVDPTKYDEWLAWAEPKVKKIDAGLEGVAFMVMAMAEKTPAAKDAMVVILKGQEADGSWKPAGQLGGMQKRSNDEARENATRLHLLALDALDPKGAAAVAAREKAAKWVARDALPESVEALIFRALYARRFGKAEEAVELRAAILKLQHADGGWGWNVKEAKSDALATGQVLHLLSLYEDQAANAEVQRAQGWLMRTQRKEDGAWPIDPMLISKTDRSGEKKAGSLKNVTEIYEFWGTVWATIGLLHWEPVVE